jgi:UDP-2,4-diacetamido-2,4,6-trideoxy-beta-L-altropyranose hydrolase
MKIKEADNSDSLDVFEWRNDPISCQMFISDNKVTLEEHKKWYESSLSNPLRKTYIGILTDEKVGICRFDIDEKMTSAEVSINLNPTMRGQNFSFELLSKSIETYMKKNNTKLTAIIKKENKASLIIFQKCSFSIVDEDASYYHLSKI